MKDLIRSIPDFPKTGVMFKDIFPLLQNRFRDTIEALASQIADPQAIDYVAGIESRGFILASALAYALNKGFIPLRKKGKLPPPTLSLKIDLEYGSDALEMKKGTGRLVLVDDVMATGGTLRGAISLAQLAGYKVREVLVLVHLQKLSSKILEKEGISVKSLYTFD